MNRYNIINEETGETTEARLSDEETIWYTRHGYLIEMIK
jgi:hypothetical protein